MPRKTQINVGFYPQDLSLMRHLAERENCSVAELVRREVQRLIKRERKEANGQ